MGGVTGEGRRRPRWVWPAVLALWAVTVLVAAYLSVHNDPATVREQRSVADAQPTVDSAVSELLRASGGVVAGAIPEIYAYDVRGGCRLTAAREGQELTRVVLFTTAP